MTKVQNGDIITPETLFEELKIKTEEYVPFGKYDPYENTIQENAAELLNMNKLPNFVSRAEYEKYDGKEITRIVHSYHGKTAEEAYNNTLKGNIQYSENTNSSYGRGIYFGEKANVEELLSFYGKEDNKIINVKLNKNAKILEFKNQLEYLKNKEERLKKVPEKLRKFYAQESSLLYMLDGIDGINLKWNNYYCIYNRKVLIVSE